MTESGKANECSGAELVSLLMNSGLSIREIESATGINRGQLSKIRHGRVTIETHWRALADLAVMNGVVRWPVNPRRK